MVRVFVYVKDDSKKVSQESQKGKFLHNMPLITICNSIPSTRTAQESRIQEKAAMLKAPARLAPPPLNAEAERSCDVPIALPTERAVPTKRSFPAKKHVSRDRFFRLRRKRSPPALVAVAKSRRSAQTGV